MKFGRILGGILGMTPIIGSLIGDRRARKEQKRQEHMMWEQSNRASLMAQKQQAERDRALRRVQQGRMRAAKRRVRGGLFGEGVSTDVSGTLGG